MTLGNALVGIVSPFMIFAVFDVLLAVNMRINYSFFLHLWLLEVNQCINYKIITLTIFNVEYLSSADLVIKVQLLVARDRNGEQITITGRRRLLGFFNQSVTKYLTN